MDIVRSEAGVSALELAPVVGLKNALAASKKPQGSEFPVLLQGDNGGLYVHERSYESFLATARRLLPNYIDKGEGLGFWVDIKRNDATQEEPINIGFFGGRETFEAMIKPLLQTPACEFRVRYDGDATQPFKKSSYTGSSIRLSHRGIGYVYVAIEWIDEPAGNSGHGPPSTVMVEAISFLFPEATRQGLRFTLVIQGEGSHDVDLRNGEDGAVKARVQAILHRLTEENKANANPVEVQIYEAAHPPFGVSNHVPSRNVATDT